MYTEGMPSINRATLPSLDPERTLELVLEALGELIDYELAVVLGLEGDETLRVRKAAGPLRDERLDGFSISLAARRDLAGIIDSGRPYLFSPDEEHVDTYDEILDLPNGHSCLVAPLAIDGKALGILTLDHRTCGMFTPGMVRFIATISRLISLSLAKSDEAASLSSANADLVRERNALLAPGYEPIAGMIGSSDAWLRAVEAIRLVAGSELPVLLRGETGTGKELAARALQEGTVERLGGERSVRVDVRVVAATHVDLERAVADGCFREDLYYRLNAFPIHLPPLRDRGGDAVLIAERFVGAIRARPGMSGLELGADAIAAIESSAWPGNVRELSNAIERAAILARGAVIGAAHLAGPGTPRLDAPRRSGPEGHGVRSFDDAKRAAIVEALGRSGGRVYGDGGAAELLGMRPSTLQSAMKRLGIAKNG